MSDDEDTASGDAGDETASLDAKKAVLDHLFIELMFEAKHGPPGARLSARLRAALERVSPAARAAVAARKADGCAPLFEAARRGNAEVVEYLVHVCCARTEQRGRFVAGDAPYEHRVTPLWVAAVAGQLAAVRALADAGADVDAPSDSGSTPLRSACFMTHLEVVRELCARGADLHRANHDGGTCLINSVQSPRLCRFLLRRGADVDARDSRRKTVLHYAVQEHRLDTVRLLLDAGASPHLESRDGDDALRTAALKGAAPVLELLAARGSYSPRRLADALELLGATQLDEYNDVDAALASWRRATALRHAGDVYLDKQPPVRREAALRGAVEWRSFDELEALAADVDALRTQALLVAVRVLGLRHRDTVFRIMYRGAMYADAMRFGRCGELWVWALRVRVARDTLLHGESAHTCSALTRLAVEARARGDGGVLAARALRVLCAGLPRAERLLRVRPRCAAQADAWDRALRCLVHLALVAERDAAGAALRPLLRRAPLRTAATGDSPLHLACSRLTAVRSSYFAQEAAAPALFPSVAAVRLLLECGADAGAANDAFSTPLHVAAIPYNFSTELVETLVNAGGHLDRPNKFGDTAAALVPLCRGSRVCVLQHTSLACLAARALLAAPAPPPLDMLPRPIAQILHLHTPHA